MSRCHSSDIKGGCFWETGQSFPFLPLPLPFPFFSTRPLPFLLLTFFFSLPFYFFFPFPSSLLLLTLSCSLSPPPTKGSHEAHLDRVWWRSASWGAPNIACKVKWHSPESWEAGVDWWNPFLGRELIMLYTGGQGVMVAFKPSDETFGVVETPYFFI
jgi:hypothetical protein